MNNWSYLSWEEIQALTESGITSAVLPIGAIEQHGPQLGCGVDTSIAHRVCNAAAQNAPVALLPTMPYGCSIGHSKRWPGTIALQPKTLIDLVFDIGSWVHASGFKRFFIVNAHVTNFAPLRCALEMLRAQHDGFMVALINTASISPRVKEAHFADADDWHANDAETSLMMAIDNEMVKNDKVSSSDDEDRTESLVFAHPVNRTSKNGVTGTPSLATTKKGEELYAWMVEDLNKVFKKGASEESPLSCAYHEQITN